MWIFSSPLATLDARVRRVLTGDRDVPLFLERRLHTLDRLADVLIHVVREQVDVVGLAGADAVLGQRIAAGQCEPLVPERGQSDPRRAFVFRLHPRVPLAGPAEVSCGKAWFHNSAHRRGSRRRCQMATSTSRLRNSARSSWVEASLITLLYSAIASSTL